MVRDDKWCLAKNRKERINAKPPISLDMSIGDGKNSFIDIIPYIDDSVDAKLAIDKLPHKLKSVIVLKYFYGFKQKDIADRLKISQAAVSRLEHKALNVLREEITA
jgi:RNA polymerase sigma factor (sigma-70 family)